jgi:hypothetical protein
MKNSKDSDIFPNPFFVLAPFWGENSGRPITDKTGSYAGCQKFCPIGYSLGGGSSPWLC